MRTHVQRNVSWCFAILRQLRQIRRLIYRQPRSDTGGSFSSVATGLWQRCIGIGLPVYLVRRLQSLCIKYSPFSDEFSDVLSVHIKHSPLWVCDEFSDVLRSLCWRSLYSSPWDCTAIYLGLLVRVSDLPGRRCLRYASIDRLVVPSSKLSTIGS